MTVGPVLQKMDGFIHTFTVSTASRFTTIGPVLQTRDCFMTVGPPIQPGGRLTTVAKAFQQSFNRENTR